MPGDLSPGAGEACPRFHPESHHLAPDHRKAESPGADAIPLLQPGEDRHLWLCRIRDFLRADSVTLTTVDANASGARDSYSSHPSTGVIRSLIGFVTGELKIGTLPGNATFIWLSNPVNPDDASRLFTALIPTPESDKASLVIVGLPGEATGAARERLVLTTTLLAQQSRLVLETGRRISAEEMFYHSQKLNSIGQLAGGIAHDFNNLLTVIQGHAGFLEMTAPEWREPKAKESIELIQKATARSVELVKQLLLFSRDRKASFEVFDLNELILDFTAMSRRMIEETVEIGLELDQKPCPVRADPGMINQILMNLVVNARDAMPEGGRIEIRSSRPRPTCGGKSGEPDEPGDGESDLVTLSIRDNGCGIPPEKLEKIFDPFFTTKPQGTGLGLANVASLVRQHRGSIGIASEPGKGTEVTIRFPVAASSALPETASAPTPAPAPGNSNPDRESIRGSRVLLVEDESAVRKLVRKLLEMHGCTVVEAHSGRAALELWPQVCDEISVVISDVVMPEGVSGWDLARELHSLHPDLGILLTSGYNEKPEDHNLGDIPNISFLQKPYPAATLKSNLYELIQHRATG